MCDKAQPKPKIIRYDSTVDPRQNGEYNISYSNI